MSNNQESRIDERLRRYLEAVKKREAELVNSSNNPKGFIKIEDHKAALRSEALKIANEIKQLRVLKNSVAIERSEVEKELDDKLEQLSRIESNVSHEENEKVRLQKKLRDKDLEIEKCATELNNCKERYKELLKDSEAANKGNTESRKTADALRTTNMGLQMEIVSLNGRLQDGQQEFKHTQEYLQSKLDYAKIQLAQKKGSPEEVEQRIQEELAKALETGKRKQNERLAKAKKEALSKQKASTKKYQSTLQNDYQQSKKDSKEALEKLEEAKKEISSLQSSLAEIQNEADENKRVLEKQQSEYKKMHSTLIKNQTENAAELESMFQEQADVFRKISNLQTEAIPQQQELDKLYKILNINQVKPESKEVKPEKYGVEHTVVVTMPSRQSKLEKASSTSTSVNDEKSAMRSVALGHRREPGTVSLKKRKLMTP